jgi:hypothetical protein
MRKGKRLINSKKISIDGVDLKSHLEGTMYRLLKENGLTFKYEGKSFLLQDSFLFNNDYYARLSSGKGDFIQRGHKKIQPITYKPDFIIEHNGYYAIIETKGLPTEAYNLRMKLFKRYLKELNVEVDIFIPQTKSECLETINIILKKIKG